MAKAKVLNANVKFDGAILAKGTVITPDHAGYKVVEKYLVDEDQFVKTNSETMVRIITKKSPDQLEEAVVVESKTAPAAEPVSDPKEDEAPVKTVAMIKEELTALGIEFDDRAKKADLEALLDASKSEPAAQ